MTDPLATEIAALLVAAGGGAGFGKAFTAWRDSRRADDLDPPATLAAAANEVAQAAATTLNSLIAPLRTELEETRAEVAQLREENARLRSEVSSLRRALKGSTRQ